MMTERELTEMVLRVMRQQLQEKMPAAVTKAVKAFPVAPKLQAICATLRHGHNSSCTTDSISKS